METNSRGAGEGNCPDWTSREESMSNQTYVTCSILRVRKILEVAKRCIRYGPGYPASPYEQARATGWKVLKRGGEMRDKNFERKCRGEIGKRAGKNCETSGLPGKSAENHDRTSESCRPEPLQGVT